MGGCRCIFRECEVTSSRYPRMHFFHFPVKDRERAMKWAAMAGRKNEIMQLTPAQQKNRVVCARHFYDVQFMNYRKDRLDRKAIPTITRLGPTLALDYENVEENGLPWLVKLEEPKMPHLIPPSDFKCPMELQDELDEIKQLKQLQREGKVLPVKSDENATVSYQISRKRPKLNTDVNDIPIKKEKVVQVLNGNELTTSGSAIASLADITLSTEVDECEKSNDNEAFKTLNLSEDIQVFKIVDIDSGDTEILKHVPLNSKISSTSSVDSCDTEECLELAEVEQSQTDDKRYEEYQRGLQSAQKQLETATETNKRLTESEERWKQKYLKLTQECRQLHNTCHTLRGKIKMLEMQQSAQNKQPQVDTISTSKECNCSSTETNLLNSTQASNLSKPQLFNGIKRYLSAAMVSLVRMEMFGNAERQWKPDEKRVSIDLLRLGENFYKYLSDEFRFRLPALRQARTWLSESNATLIDNEEDL